MVSSSLARSIHARTECTGKPERNIHRQSKVRRVLWVILQTLRDRKEAEVLRASDHGEVGRVILLRLRPWRGGG